MGEFPNKATMFSSENQPKNNGRKPKSFKLFNDLMKEQGFEPLSKEELIRTYSYVFSIDEETAMKIVDDETQPVGLRTIIAELSDERTRMQAMKDYRDYAFGKAGESIKVTKVGLDREEEENEIYERAK